MNAHVTWRENGGFCAIGNWGQCQVGPVWGPTRHAALVRALWAVFKYRIVGWL